MYRLLWGRDACPRLGRVSAQLVRDWGSSGSCRFRFRRRLWCFLPVGARLRLAAPPSGAGPYGGAGSPICLRFPIDHWDLSQAG